MLLTKQIHNVDISLHKGINYFYSIILPPYQKMSLL